jgi:hypothetical protein
MQSLMRDGAFALQVRKEFRRLDALTSNDSHEVSFGSTLRRAWSSSRRPMHLRHAANVVPDGLQYAVAGCAGTKPRSRTRGGDLDLAAGDPWRRWESVQPTPANSPSEHPDACDSPADSYRRPRDTGLTLEKVIFNS